MPRVPTFVALALAAHAVTAAAQCTPGGPPNLPARSGALIGVVMDSLHLPIEGAEVFISRPARKARSETNGRFTLDSLKPGIYTISVRKIGYEMAVQDYDVIAAGSHARFCLVAEPVRLVPMIASAKRMGLGGVVGDSTYGPLLGAEVKAMGTADRAVTDSTGEFFLPLKPGTHAVLVTSPGFGRQLLSVTIPKDSGRQVAVWLGSVPRNPNTLAVAYDNMRLRILNANANRSALVSPEVLSKRYDTFFAAQAAINDKIPPECMAMVDGGPWQLPLAAIAKEDIAFMELYLVKGPRSGPTSIGPAGTQGGKVLSTQAPRQGAPCGAFEVWVWLK